MSNASEAFKEVTSLIRQSREKALHQHFDKVFEGDKSNIFVSQNFQYGIVFGRYHDLETKEVTGSVSINGKVVLSITYLLDGFSPYMKYEDMFVDAVVNLIYREERKFLNERG